jgi:hypothetical protein
MVPTQAMGAFAAGAGGLYGGWFSRGRVCHEVPISTERAQRYIRS